MGGFLTPPRLPGLTRAPSGGAPQRPPLAPRPVGGASALDGVDDGDLLDRPFLAPPRLSRASAPEPPPAPGFYERVVQPVLRPVQAALGASGAAVGRLAGEVFPEAYARAAEENQLGAPEDPGLAEEIVRSPGAGQVLVEALIPGTRPGFVGVGKRALGLGGDIFTDPLTYASGGLAGAARAVRQQRYGSALARTLGSPLAGAAYAPEIARGGYSALQQAIEAREAGSSILSEEVLAPASEALLMAGLGAGMARGAAENVREGRVVDRARRIEDIRARRLAGEAEQARVSRATVGGSLDDFAPERAAEEPAPGASVVDAPLLEPPNLPPAQPFDPTSGYGGAAEFDEAMDIARGALERESALRAQLDEIDARLERGRYRGPAERPVHPLELPPRERLVRTPEEAALEGRQGSAIELPPGLERPEFAPEPPPAPTRGVVFREGQAAEDARVAEEQRRAGDAEMAARTRAMAQRGARALRLQAIDELAARGTPSQRAAAAAAPQRPVDDLLAGPRETVLPGEPARAAQSIVDAEGRAVPPAPEPPLVRGRVATYPPATAHDLGSAAARGAELVGEGLKRAGRALRAIPWDVDPPTLRQESSEGRATVLVRPDDLFRLAAEDIARPGRARAKVGASDKLERAQNFLAGAEEAGVKVHTPEISVDPGGQKLIIGDGYHRAQAAADEGQSLIPVRVDRSQLGQLRALGVSYRDLLTGDTVQGDNARGVEPSAGAGPDAAPLPRAGAGGVPGPAERAPEAGEPGVAGVPPRGVGGDAEGGPTPQPAPGTAFDFGGAVAEGARVAGRVLTGRPIRPIPDKRPAGPAPAPERPQRPTVFTPRGPEAVLQSPTEREVGKMAAAAVDTQAPREEGKPSPDPGQPEHDVNISRVSSDDSVSQFIGRLVGAAPDFFGKVRGGARGAARPWAEVRRRAIDLGLDVRGVQRAFRRKGGFLSDVELEAASILQKEAVQDARAQYEKFTAQTAAGKHLEAESHRDLYEASISKLASLQYALIGAKSEAARTLALARKLSEGLTPEERAYQRIFRNSKLDERFHRNFLDAVTRGDMDKARETLRQAYSPKFLEQVAEAWKSGLLSAPPTHAVNFASNAFKTLVLDVVDAVGAGAVDSLRGLSPAQRDRFAGEGFAMLRGAREAMPAAWTQLTRDLRSIFRLQYEGQEFAQGIKSGWSDESKVEFRRSLPGKFGEAYRIPFQLLDAADSFWKTVAGSQELFRVGYRTGRQRALSGNSLDAFVRDFRSQYASGSLPNQLEVAAQVLNAKRRGTFTEPTGAIATGLQTMARNHPLLQFFVPFIKTPVNIAKSTVAHLPPGVFLSVYKRLKGQIDSAQFADELARGVVGTTLAGAMYMLASESDEDFAVTGGGPTDPTELQNLRDNLGWQPYSFKVGDTYYSYQRLEPISSIIGMAADMAEAQRLKGGKPGAFDVFDKLAASITENLTNKTFLSGVEGLATMLHDPRRYAAQWVKQMEGSLVPNIVARAAYALDPTVREAQPYETKFGLPEPVVARVPGLSSSLAPRQSALGGDRTRPGTAAERFLSPFPTSTEKTGPAADLAREYHRIGYVPEQPSRELRLAGGHSITLDDREYAILQAAHDEATKRATRMLKSRYYRALPDLEGEGPGDNSKEEVLRKLVREARKRARIRLYQDPKFRRRAAAERARVERERRGVRPAPGKPPQPEEPRA